MNTFSCFIVGSEDSLVKTNRDRNIDLSIILSVLEVTRTQDRWLKALTPEGWMVGMKPGRTTMLITIKLVLPCNLNGRRSVLFFLNNIIFIKMASCWYGQSRAFVVYSLVLKWSMDAQYFLI